MREAIDRSQKQRTEAGFDPPTATVSTPGVFARWFARLSVIKLIGTVVVFLIIVSVGVKSFQNSETSDWILFTTGYTAEQLTQMAEYFKTLTETYGVDEKVDRWTGTDEFLRSQNLADLFVKIAPDRYIMRHPFQKGTRNPSCEFACSDEIVNIHAEEAVSFCEAQGWKLATPQELLQLHSIDRKILGFRIDLKGLEWTGNWEFNLFSTNEYQVFNSQAVEKEIWLPADTLQENLKFRCSFSREDI